MTTVFVHGVPETARVWDKVRAGLGRDSVALSLPGFGVPRPAGFGSTMEEYLAWLRAELAALGEPVDLVGHDWGGLLVTRLATTPGTPLRSWVTDAVGAADEGFSWHDFARVWQTPGEGEAFWEGVRASPADSALIFTSLGVPAEDALPMAEAIDEEMCASILALYRSAVDIGRQWGATTATPTAPGLVLFGTQDAYGSEAKSRAIGARLGAEVAPLEGATHWWPMERPDEAVSCLNAFWARLG